MKLTRFIIAISILLSLFVLLPGGKAEPAQSASVDLSRDTVLSGGSYYPDPHPILTNLSVRRGLAYCTDRKALAQAAYPALSEAEIDALMMDSFFPKDHWVYTQPTAQYDYDPVQGRALLEQAGWTLPDGATYRVNAAGEELALVLTTSLSEVRYAYAEVLEAQWLACGVRLVRLHAPGTWLFGETTGLARRDFEVASYAWTDGGDPQVAPFYACDQIPGEVNAWQGNNRMGWCNPTASAEAYLGDNISLTQAGRKAHYAIVQEEFAEEVPSLPLFLRSPVDGSWEHLDFYITRLEAIFLPLLSH